MDSFRLKEAMFSAVSNSIAGKEGKDSTLEEIQERPLIGAQALGWVNLGQNPTSHTF